MKTYLLLLMGLLGSVPLATADINLRISVKFILGPRGQMPCCGNGTFDAFEDITNQVDAANAVLRATGRGYRFKITEVTTVSGAASDFYSIPREEKEDLEVAAKADPVTFAWRDNAINMYVNDAAGSAICSFPTDDDVILFGQNSRSTSLFHESGHYFNLKHTQQGETKDDDCTEFTPGNGDSIADTLADSSCWSKRSQLVAYYPTATSTQIDNIWFNMMSYHSTRDRLTSDQLDRMTDAANGSRDHVASGRTRFVDWKNASGFLPTGSSQSLLFGLGGPFPTVAQGVSVAKASDIVLVRKGTYLEPLTFNKRLTLRATRGDAIIR